MNSLDTILRFFFFKKHMLFRLVERRDSIQLHLFVLIMQSLYANNFIALVTSIIWIVFEYY